MAADKHYPPASPVPDTLEDHKPDDMPAARSMIMIIVSLLAVCVIIAAVIYGLATKDTELEEPVVPQQQQNAPVPTP